MCRPAPLIRLVIVEPGHILRMGLMAALESDGSIEVVGEFETIDGITAAVGPLVPDVVLLSTGWPAADALRVCRKLRSAMPATKVLLLSSTEQLQEIVAAISAGASGYVPPGVTRSELLRAVEVAANGGSYFDREATERSLARLSQLAEGGPESDPARLSERERRILAMIARGLTNEQIGQHLNLAASTVRNNITKIRSKLNLYSRTKLVAYAYDNGIREDAEVEAPAPEEGS